MFVSTVAQNSKKTAKKRGLNHSHELYQQKYFMDWCKLRKLDKYVVVSANGGVRHKKTAVELKLSGVRAGIPDIFIMIPKNGYHGLFIEMKRERKYKSKATQDQLAFLQLAQSMGYAATIAYGWQEAAKITMQYLDIK